MNLGDPNSVMGSFLGNRDIQHADGPASSAHFEASIDFFGLAKFGKSIYVCDSTDTCMVIRRIYQDPDTEESKLEPYPQLARDNNNNSKEDPDTTESAEDNFVKDSDMPSCNVELQTPPVQKPLEWIPRKQTVLIEPGELTRLRYQKKTKPQAEKKVHKDLMTQLKEAGIDCTNEVYVVFPSGKCYGRIDILTSNAIIEVKRADLYADAVGQIKRYGASTVKDRPDIKLSEFPRSFSCTIAIAQEKKGFAVMQEKIFHRRTSTFSAPTVQHNSLLH